MIVLSFIGITLAWSFSWFAMTLQVASIVPLELSVFYRFASTAVLMFVLCVITKQRTTLGSKEWRFIIVIGLCNFCLNFLIGYFTVRYIPSGVIATIFSLSIITSEIIAALIDKRKIEKKVIISSVIGFLGLAFFILPSIHFGANSNILKIATGLFLALLMMTIYSFGNVLVAKNRKINATPLYTLIAYSATVGSIFLLLFNLILGNKFIFDFSLSYVLSFSYLVLIASVLAFICLFYMIQNVGSTKANYTALIYPAIALTTSAYFEGFEMSFFSAIGFMMIVSALIIEFLPSVKKFRRK